MRYKAYISQTGASTEYEAPTDRKAKIMASEWQSTADSVYPMVLYEDFTGNRDYEPIFRKEKGVWKHVFD